MNPNASTGASLKSPGTARKVWSSQLFSPVKSSPVVVDDVVYVRSIRGTLYALDAATGDQKWFGGVFESSPAAVGSVVYFGSNNHNVYALNAKDGSQKWNSPMGFAVESSPVVVDNVVYVVDVNGTLYALDIATGDQKWNSDPTRLAVKSLPVVGGSMVYINSSDSKVYALDATTGDQKWASDPTGFAVESSPVVVGSMVYIIRSLESKVYALDAKDGSQKWASSTTQFKAESSPVVGGSMVYIISSLDSKVYALDAATGDQKWASDPTRLTVESSPVVGGSMVYIISSLDSKVYALDAKDGNQKWAYQPADASNSLLVVDGVVYVSSLDGYVDALDAKDGSQKWSYQIKNWFSSIKASIHSSPTVVDGVVYVGSGDGNVYALENAQNITIDTTGMIPLPLKDTSTRVNLIGTAIADTTKSKEVEFDTGSFVTSIPREWLAKDPSDAKEYDKTKITVLATNIQDTWKQQADLVQGELGIQGDDGKPPYTVEKYIFFASYPNPDPTKGTAIIVGAMPTPVKVSVTTTGTRAPGTTTGTVATQTVTSSWNVADDIDEKGDQDTSGNPVTTGVLKFPTPASSSTSTVQYMILSLPHQIALNTCLPGKVGYGIVSITEGDIDQNYEKAKFYLFFGADPNIIGNLNWAKQITTYHGTTFSPDAIYGFKVKLSFPDEDERPPIVVSDLIATSDTGYPELALRLAANDPQVNDYKEYFVSGASGAGLGGDTEKYKDQLVASDKVAVTVEFTDSNGHVSSYTFQAGSPSDNKSGNQVMIGTWSGKIPWPIGQEYPTNRINLGNTLFFYSPVFFYDISNQRVGIYPLGSHASDTAIP